jgi:hypothetical protein
MFRCSRIPIMVVAQPAHHRTEVARSLTSQSAKDHSRSLTGSYHSCGPIISSLLCYSSYCRPLSLDSQCKMFYERSVLLKQPRAKEMTRQNRNR